MGLLQPSVSTSDFGSLVDPTELFEDCNVASNATGLGTLATNEESSTSSKYNMKRDFFYNAANK